METGDERNGEEIRREREQVNCLSVQIVPRSDPLMCR